jgi:N-acetylmuramoyl-L-alanine amidase
MEVSHSSKRQLSQSACDNVVMRAPSRFLITLMAGIAGCCAVQAEPPAVAVDVGHTLEAPGAISARGRPEFAFNRDLAAEVVETLKEKGLRIVPVNFDGRIASLEERPAQAVGADFFLSIHHDSVGEDFLQHWQWNGQDLTYTEAKRGFAFFVSANNPDPSGSLACASAMGARLRRMGFLPAPQHRWKHIAADGENGVWYYDNLVVLYRTSVRAVLFEAGVIKHREEELELSDVARQALMADGLATGIAACLQVRGKPVRE